MKIIHFKDKFFYFKFNLNSHQQYNHLMNKHLQTKTILFVSIYTLYCKLKNIINLSYSYIMKKVFLIVITLISAIISQAQELVGDYKFCGDVYDQSDNSGINSVSIVSGYTADRFGKAFSAVPFFEGAKDAISINRQIQDNFSISFWLKTNQKDFTDYARLGNIEFPLVDAGIGSTGNENDFGVVLKQGGYIGFYTGAPYTLLTSPNPVSDNNWHHIVATREVTEFNSILKLYIDNVLVATDLGGTNSLNDISDISMGGRNGHQYFYNGVLDDVKIYNGAISVDEINKLYTETATCNLKVDLNAPTNITESGFNLSWYDLNVNFEYANQMYLGANPIRYNIEIATDNNFTNIVQNLSDITVTQNVITGLNSNTTYYVRMRAQDINNNYTDYSNTFTVSTSKFEKYSPVAVTGFDVDVVANGIDPNAVTYTASIDDLNYGSGNLFYEKGYLNDDIVFPLGMPNEKLITSESNSSITYQLQDYATTNALQISNTSKSLVLNTPSSYSKISLLATASGFPSNVKIQLNFEDGTNVEYPNVYFSNWFDGGSYALNNLSRFNWGAATSDQTTNNPRIYDNIINIAPSDQLKKISSIDFMVLDGSILTVFAVSGVSSINAPSQISISNVVNDGFTTSWSPVTDATSYLVDIATDKDFIQKLTSYTNFETTDSKIIATGLNPNSIYHIRVAAKNIEGNTSDYSKSKMVSTINMPGSGNALNLSGEGQYLDLGKIDQDLTNGFTLSMWVNPSSSDYFTRFFDLGNGAGNSNIILTRYADSPELYFSISNGGTSSNYVSQSVIENNVWQHLAAVYNPADNQLLLYKNGILVGSTNLEGFVLDNNARFSNFIGKSNWDSDAYFKGQIDEACIWNRTLSQTEIRDRMCKKLDRNSETNLIYYARFDESTNNGTTENIGTGLEDATLVNGPNFIASGAAIGDNSNYTYDVGTTEFQVGDIKLSDFNIENAQQGLQTYTVLTPPNTTELNNITGISANTYTGIFPVNIPSYKINYNYSTIQELNDTDNEEYALLASRKDNSVTNWSKVSNASLDKDNNIIQTVAFTERAEIVPAWNKITLIAPTNICLVPDGNKVNLNWTEVPVIDGYEVYYGLDSTDINSMTIVHVATNQTVITDLIPGSTYYFAAKAKGGPLSMFKVATAVKGAGKSIYLNGDNILLTSYPTNFNFSNSDFLIDMWIKPEITNKRQDLLSNHDWWTDYVNFKLYIDKDSLLKFEATNEISLNFSSTKKIEAQKWSHVAIQRKGVTFSLFINEEEVGNGFINITLPNFSDLDIGGTYIVSTARIANPNARLNLNQDEYFNLYKGEIDEIRIINPSLSETNFIENKDSRVSTSNPGIVSMYSFEDVLNSNLLPNSKCENKSARMIGNVELRESRAMLPFEPTGLRFESPLLVWDNNIARDIAYYIIYKKNGTTWDSIGTSTNLTYKVLQSPCFSTYYKVLGVDSDNLKGIISDSVEVISLQNITAGRIVDYKLNGDLKDSLGFANDGLVNNYSFVNDRFNKPNKAITFNDANGIRITASTFMPSEITYNIWIKEGIDNFNTIQKIMNVDGIWPGLSRTGNTFTVTGPFLNNNTTMSSYDSLGYFGVWKNITLTYNSKTYSGNVYFNGKLKISYTLDYSQTGRFKSESQLRTSASANGISVDDMVIYNRILTESEIVILNQDFVRDTARLCEGLNGSIAATIIEGANYTWSGKLDTVSAKFNLNNVNISQQGMYHLEVNTGCQMIKDSIYVQVLQMDSIQTKFNICMFDSVPKLNLLASNLRWYDINNEAILPPTIDSTNAGITTYLVSQQLGGWCESPRKELSVNVYTPSISILTSKHSLCKGDSVTITASGAKTYVWNDTLVKNSKAFLPLVSKNYTLRATDSLGCFVDTSINININQKPIVSILSNNKVCLGDTINLTASVIKSNNTEVPIEEEVPIVGGRLKAQGVLSWSKPILSNDQYEPLKTDTLIASFTDDSLCTGKDTMIITVSPKPQIKIITTDSVLCMGDSTKLSLTGAHKFVWSNNSNTVDSIVKPSVNTSFVVYGQDTISKCYAYDTLSVKVNNTPIVIATASKYNLCEGDSITLIGNGAKTYIWNDTIPDNKPFVVSKPARYTVLGTDTNTCSATAFIDVFVSAKPKVNIVFSNNFPCEGDSITISVNGADKYIFSNGIINNQTLKVDSILKGTVKSIDLLGCTSIDTFQLKTNPKPILTDIIKPIEYCNSNTATAIDLGLTLKTNEYINWYGIDTNAIATNNAPLPDLNILGKSKYYFNIQNNVTLCKSDFKNVAVLVNTLPQNLSLIAPTYNGKDSLKWNTSYQLSGKDYDTITKVNWKITPIISGTIAGDSIAILNKGYNYSGKPQISYQIESGKCRSSWSDSTSITIKPIVLFTPALLYKISKGDSLQLPIKVLGSSPFKLYIDSDSLIINDSLTLITLKQKGTYTFKSIKDKFGVEYLLNNQIELKFDSLTQITHNTKSPICAGGLGKLNIKVLKVKSPIKLDVIKTSSLGSINIPSQIVDSLATFNLLPGNYIANIKDADSIAYSPIIFSITDSSNVLTLPIITKTDTNSVKATDKNFSLQLSNLTNVKNVTWLTNGFIKTIDTTLIAKINLTDSTSGFVQIKAFYESKEGCKSDTSIEYSEYIYPVIIQNTTLTSVTIGDSIEVDLFGKEPFVVIYDVNNKVDSVTNIYGRKLKIKTANLGYIKIISIKDASGVTSRTSIDTIQIIQDSLSISKVDTINAPCKGKKGIVKVSAIGKLPITYKYYLKGNILDSTNSTFTNNADTTLLAGIYEVIAKDGDGKNSKPFSFTILENEYSKIPIPIATGPMSSNVYSISDSIITNLEVKTKIAGAEKYIWTIKNPKAGIFLNDSSKTTLKLNSNFSGNIGIGVMAYDTLGCLTDTSMLINYTRKGEVTFDQSGKISLFYKDTANVKLIFKGSAPFSISYKYQKISSQFTTDSNEVYFKLYGAGSTDSLQIKDKDGLLVSLIGSITTTLDTVTSSVSTVKSPICDGLKGEVTVTVKQGKAPYKLNITNINTNTIEILRLEKSGDKVYLNPGNYTYTITDSADYTSVQNPDWNFKIDTAQNGYLEFKPVITINNSVPTNLNNDTILDKSKTIIPGLTTNKFNWNVSPAEALSNILDTTNSNNLVWNTDYSGPVSIIVNSVYNGCPTGQDTLSFVLKPYIYYSIENNRTVVIKANGKKPLELSYTKNDKTEIIKDITDIVRLQFENAQELFMIQIKDSLGNITSLNNLEIEKQYILAKFYEGFSPNGDGKNDLYRVQDYEFDVRSAKFEVFDMNGFVVYSNDNFKGIWDGNDQNGNLLPSGNYYFVFTDSKGNNTSSEIENYVIKTNHLDSFSLEKNYRPRGFIEIRSDK